MAHKIRKQIYIDTAQEERLKQIAATTGESEAAIIRRAIDGITAQGSVSGLYRSFSSPEAWQRALQRMRRSTLTPRPGVTLFDRDALHERS